MSTPQFIRDVVNAADGPPLIQELGSAADVVSGVEREPLLDEAVERVKQNLGAIRTLLAAIVAEIAMEVRGSRTGEKGAASDLLKVWESDHHVGSGKGRHLSYAVSCEAKPLQEELTEVQSLYARAESVLSPGAQQRIFGYFGAIRALIAYVAPILLATLDQMPAERAQSARTGVGHWYEVHTPQS